MAVSRIELVGTENLISSTKLLVYNTETFQNKGLIEKFSLPEIPEIGRSTVNNILETLLDTGYYELLSKPFSYRNNSSDVLGGQGFDTIIFLRDDTLLGYAYLGKIYGQTYSSSGTTYVVKQVNIKVVGENGTSLIIGDDLVNFNMSITDQKPRVENLKREVKSYIGSGNYGTHIKEILKSGKTDILTDSLYVKSGKYSGRLSLETITLSDNYSSFENTMLGYFKGDPSLYIWDDNCRYSIISLTKKIKFNENYYIPYPHTPAKADSNGNPISRSEIYTIPDLGKGEQKILYFSGQLCIIEADEERYIFDVSRQNADPGIFNKGWLVKGYDIVQDSFLYYKRIGERWVLQSNEDKEAKYFDSLDVATSSNVKVPYKIPKFINNFVIGDNGKICEIESYGWKSYQEAIRDVGDLCNTFVDSKTLVETGCSLVKKQGDWFVFDIPSDNTYLYSNMTMGVKFLKTENPMVVNNEILLERTSTMEYTLYDSPGLFISKKCFDRLYQIGKEYRFSIKTFSFEENNPINIQKGFFGPFRRNIIPTSLEGMSIAGALSGIIYYRKNNTFSYL